MFLGFLVGIQLARQLGPAGYGIYGVAMSVFSILMLPTEFGLPQLVTREVAVADVTHDQSAIKRLLWWSLKFVVLSSVAIALLILPLLIFDTPLLDPSLQAPLAWALLLLPMVAVSNISSAALRGLHRVIEGQVSELLIRPGLLSGFLFLTVLFLGNDSLSPDNAMAMNVVASCVGAAYAATRLSRLTGLHAVSQMFGGESRKWLSDSFSLALGDGMRIISGQIAVLVIAVFATNADVGIYRVAFGIYVVATLPSALLNAVCSPTISTLNREGRRSAIQKLNAWMALFLVGSAIACLLPFVFYGEQIINFIFGSDYSTSNSVLLILLVGELLAAAIGHPTIVLNMLNHERIVVRCSTVALVVNVGSCLLFVPVLGPEGAAASVALSQLVWRILASYYAYTRIGLNTTILGWGK